MHDTLSDDERRALSLAYGHGVAVLRIPDVVGAPVGSRGPRIAWQSEDETASVTVDDSSAISVHTIDPLTVKTALDLASGLVAIAARVAAGLGASAAPGER